MSKELSEPNVDHLLDEILSSTPFDRDKGGKWFCTLSNSREQ